MEWKSGREGRSNCLYEKQKHYSHLCQGCCWRTRIRDRSVLFLAFLLGFSRYPGTSVLVTSASDGILVFMEDLVYTGLMGLSSSVLTGRCCLRIIKSLKVSLSEVVLLTADVSWQPLFFITRSRVEWVLHQRWTLCPKTRLQLTLPVLLLFLAIVCMLIEHFLRMYSPRN